jgi:hypothetical protein
VAKSNSFIDIVIGYNHKLFTSTSNTNFLGIVIQNSLSWKAHVDQLVLEMCTACYAIRAIKPFMSLDTLKLVYYSYFHSVMNYGIIFWEDSSHSFHVFRLQKRVIRFITRSRHRNSCRVLFNKLKILPFQSHYMFSLVLFAVNNTDQYKLNSEIHGIDTRETPTFTNHCLT